MIIMNLELDNILAFEDFTVNFSYPKKIVNSLIPMEWLETKPNFRYKKVNILVGANASGKTSLGRAMMLIFNFLARKRETNLIESIQDKNKATRFSIDFLVDENTLYRATYKIPSLDEEATRHVKLDIYSAKISKQDSYESCVKKLQLISDENSHYTENLEVLPSKLFTWLFTFPTSDEIVDTLKSGDSDIDLEIFTKILNTLDPNIIEVKKSSEVENSYIIVSKSGTIFLQDGEIVNKNILSSGTKMGIDIASVIDSIKKETCSFFFCDEKFSYIQTDIEQTILSVMIALLTGPRQLFFTTHNLDILQMGMPVHSFLFLKKNDVLEIVHPENVIKKNDISLRRAVENDVFNINPDVDKLFDLIPEELKCR